MIVPISLFSIRRRKLLEVIRKVFVWDICNFYRSCIFNVASLVLLAYCRIELSSIRLMDSGGRYCSHVKEIGDSTYKRFLGKHHKDIHEL